MKFALCWDTMGGSSWQITRSAAASPPFLQSLQWRSGVTSVHIPNLPCTKLSWDLSPADKLSRSEPGWKTEGIFSDKNIEYFQTKMVKSIWKDRIRILNPSSPITMLWWWHWQLYTLISQSLNFVAVLVSQSFNSCGQVILKLEPRAPFQLHKWQPFRRSVKEVKCTFTVHFAGTGIEVIFQSSDRWRAKLCCSIFSQTLNPLSDETGPSVLLVQLLQDGSAPSVCLATNSTSSPRIFILAARALPQPLCCVSHQSLPILKKSEKIWAGLRWLTLWKRVKIKCYPQRKLKNKAYRMNYVCVSQTPVLCYS